MRSAHPVKPRPATRPKSRHPLRQRCGGSNGTLQAEVRHRTWRDRRQELSSPQLPSSISSKALQGLSIALASVQDVAM